uniref:EOG090X0BI6 n=1 Tax=Evadne anonyx TaxID=141404 RepID=A0A9N6ZF65_9CRUS|nr:EOG090X0BI6 [Evadne anonyx]
MGRTVICEDGIEEYGAALIAKKELTVGLVFGQEISSQKSCVIHIARTPEFVDEDSEHSHEKEQTSKSQSKVAKGKSPSEDFDEISVIDHVRQVIRALPGGITVLGLFIVSGFDVFQNQTLINKIRMLLTSIDNIIGKSPITLRQQLTCERVVLHICNKSRKYTCKTIDIASPISSPKPAEWKFVNAAGSPWIELYCTLNVEFYIGLSDSESSSSLRQQLETGISIYSKSVQQSLCLIDNKLLPDSDLLESPKEKGKKKQHQTDSEERIKTINIQVLIPEIETKSGKQECSSDMRFGGQMCIKAYIHGKGTVGEACQIVKEDILRSLWARCDMHSDSLIGDEQRGQPDVRAVLHEPPRRVLAPLPYSPISVADYLFPGEGPADSLASLADLLDLGLLQEGDVQDYWEAAAEVNEALEAECALEASTITKQQSTAASPPANSRVILLSGLIALLSVMLSYFILQAFRSN